ncbi:hypothetical protein H2200_003312 [Cladophialophora chaetospira]|uniref:Fungal N-terminal domain-containing protein n=1 Tax=Cladophialophora chaetospira TaxID=386627 RepID=A0AA39CM58_9EURO|nr:hypothetical protein H2200_003312 [Cladophialophora chaetospira]
MPYNIPHAAQPRLVHYPLHQHPVSSQLTAGPLQQAVVQQVFAPIPFEDLQGLADAVDSVERIPKMADPLSVLSSLLAVSDAGLKVASRLYSFARALKSSVEDIQRLAEELDMFSKVLNQLHDWLKDNQNIVSQGGLDLANQILTRCRKTFKEIKKMLGTGADDNFDAPKFWDRIKFVFQHSRIEPLRLNLESCKLLISLQLTLFQFAEFKQAHKVEAPSKTVKREEKKLRTIAEHSLLSTQHSVVKWQDAAQAARLQNSYPNQISIDTLQIPHTVLDSRWVLDMVPTLRQPHLTTSPYRMLTSPEHHKKERAEQKKRMDQAVETLLSNWTKLDTKESQANNERILLNDRVRLFRKEQKSKSESPEIPRTKQLGQRPVLGHRDSLVEAALRSVAKEENLTSAQGQKAALTDQGSSMDENKIQPPIHNAQMNENVSAHVERHTAADESTAPDSDHTKHAEAITSDPDKKVVSDQTSIPHVRDSPDFDQRRSAPLNTHPSALREIKAGEVHTIVEDSSDTEVTNAQLAEEKLSSRKTHTHIETTYVPQSSSSKTNLVSGILDGPSNPGPLADSSPRYTVIHPLEIQSPSPISTNGYVHLPYPDAELSDSDSLPDSIPSRAMSQLSLVSIKPVEGENSHFEWPAMPRPQSNYPNAGYRAPSSSSGSYQPYSPPPWNDQAHGFSWNQQGNGYPPPPNVSPYPVQYAGPFYGASAYPGSPYATSPYHPVNTGYPGYGYQTGGINAYPNSQPYTAGFPGMQTQTFAPPWRVPDPSPSPQSPGSDDSSKSSGSDEVISTSHSLSKGRDESEATAAGIISGVSTLLKSQNEKFEALLQAQGTPSQGYQYQSRTGEEEEKAEIRQAATAKFVAELDEMIYFVGLEGRKFPFPFWQCRTWERMRALIEQTQRQDGPKVNLDDHGSFSLVDEDGHHVMPLLWSDTIKPGSTITLEMTFPAKRQSLRSIVDTRPAMPNLGHPLHISATHAMRRGKRVMREKPVTEKIKGNLKIGPIPEAPIPPPAVASSARSSHSSNDSCSDEEYSSSSDGNYENLPRIGKRHNSHKQVIDRKRNILWGNLDDHFKRVLETESSLAMVRARRKIAGMIYEKSIAECQKHGLDIPGSSKSVERQSEPSRRKVETSNFQDPYLQLAQGLYPFSPGKEPPHMLQPPAPLALSRSQHSNKLRYANGAPGTRADFEDAYSPTLTPTSSTISPDPGFPGLHQEKRVEEKIDYLTTLLARYEQNALSHESIVKQAADERRLKTLEDKLLQPQQRPNRTTDGVESGVPAPLAETTSRSMQQIVALNNNNVDVVRPIPAMHASSNGSSSFNRRSSSFGSRFMRRVSSKKSDKPRGSSETVSTLAQTSSTGA